MGYACPVCDHPQADAVHLANHLAFTALSRGGDHEEWLDDRVPEWEQLGEEGLAEHVTEYADEREYPQVFEDTTGQHEHTRDGDATSGAGSDTESVPDAMLAAAERRLADEGTPDTEEVLAEARRLTSERREDSETE